MNNRNFQKIKPYGSIKRRKPLRLIKNTGRITMKNVRSISDSLVDYYHTRNGDIDIYRYSSNSSSSSRSSSSSSCSSNYGYSYRKVSGDYTPHGNLEIALASKIRSINRSRSRRRNKKRKRGRRESDEHQYQEESESSECGSEINSRGKRRRLAGGYSSGEARRYSYSGGHGEKYGQDSSGQLNRNQRATATPSLFTVASVFSFLAGMSLSLYNKYSN